LDTAPDDTTCLTHRLQRQVGSESKVTVHLEKDDIRALHQVLSGVNVVDTDDFFSGDFGIPDDEIMQKLVDDAYAVYQQVYGVSPSQKQ
jgi:hypothetical protein